MNGRNAGRIIAAILKPLQRIDKTLRDRTVSNDPNNSAHANPQSLPFRRQVVAIFSCFSIGSAVTFDFQPLRKSVNP
jgi:hypothetical protein